MQWDSDAKVLRAIYEIELEGGELERSAISERAGTDDATTKWAIAHFARAGFIRASDMSDHRNKNDFLVRGIEPKGLERLGEWPSIESLTADLVGRLQEAAEAISDPKERGIIQRFVESVSAGVATAFVTKHAPWL